MILHKDLFELLAQLPGQKTARIQDHIGLALDKAKLFPFQADATVDPALSGKRMRSSRFFIALHQCGIAAVQKQDFIRDLLLFPVFQNLLQLRQLFAATDIDAKRHSLMGCRFLHDKLHKRFHQGDRQIIYTIKA